MKLLIIYHSGLADDAKHIFREYAKQEVDLTVIVPLKNGSLVFSDKDVEETFRYIPLKFKAGFNFFQLFWTIKKIGPEIIYVMDEYTSLPLFQAILCRNMLYEKKIPVFSLSFQNLPLHHPPFTFASPKAFLKRISHKILIPLMVHYHKRNLAGIVCGNKDAIKIIEVFGIKTATKLIYWGVNLEIFSPKNKNACREKLGLPQEIKIAGYFGKIYKEKGLENLVKVASRLADWHLLLVGNGAYKEELKNLISSLGMRNRVYFYDFVKLKDLSDYYNSLDVYVLPTYTTKDVKEQYGRVLVEAMACRIPIIGSTCGAIPEVLEGYPAHLIFNEYSLSDLADKIKKIENIKLPESFDIKGFLKKFSAEDFVSENIKFYKYGN